MLFEAAGLILVVALLVVLPGHVLLRAVLPEGARLGRVARFYVDVATGTLLLTGVGLILGFLPSAGDRGFFRTAATGFPNVELAMTALTAGLFWVGLQRGAYPAFARRFPGLTERLLGKGDRVPGAP